MLIAILGRQAKLSVAELESLVGSQNIVKTNEQVAMIDAELDLNQLGGIIKLGRVESSDLNSYLAALEQIKKYYLNNPPDSKRSIGVSLYSFKHPRLNRDLLSLKKELVKAGLSIRIVNQPKADQLNAAVISKNNLLGKNGEEWLIAKVQGKFVLAKTLQVQDLSDYTKRDRGRPKRDARVGMLPPKLAQIMINLVTNGKDEAVIYDPFCGTGVVLQEALLKGYQVYGSDLDSRMIDYTKQNLAWLKSEYQLSFNINLSVGDSRSVQVPDQVSHIVSETYLGPPLSSTPNNERLNQIIDDLNNLHRKFLKNIQKQTSPGFKLCLAVPAIHTKNTFKRLPLIDDLEHIGYNQHDFKHSSKPLIYHRPGQVVARDILLLERI